MKKLFLTIACLVSALAAFAETGSASDTREIKVIEETKDSTLLFVNKFSKNWEVSLYLGAQNFLAEYTRFNTLNDMWCPAIDFNINKWASPSWGLGLGANVAGYKGLYYFDDKKAIFARPDDPAYEKDKGFYMASGSYGNVFVKAMFNATNLLGRYKPDRVFELTGYLGGGVLFPMCKVNYSSVGASLNAGLNFQFHVSKRVLLGFSVRGALYSDGFNGISYMTSPDNNNISLDGMIGATAGVSYRFGYASKKNRGTGKVEEYEWLPVVETTYIVEKIVSDTVYEVKTVKDVDTLDYWIHIPFAVDKWDISNNGKVNLMSASQHIKSCPGKVFYVRGYADKQTATAAHNSMLAENRANAVRDVLVNEFGVDPAQLKVEQYGGVDYMFYNDEVCSRCVIISSK